MYSNGKLTTANWKPAGRDAKVYDNILHVIGNTPMVKLNRIPKDHGLECEIYAKCEFLNPGGSIKDRMSYTMVVDAENRGRAREGTRFVEPTSGNTGIGISLTAAVKGYKATIVTPDKNSTEKLSAMRLLGADIVQTPSAAKTGEPDHFMSVAQRLVSEDPDHNISLDQYSNPVNPVTHTEFTAHEILDALGPVDMVVMGAGTGGTVTGVAHLLKEKCPDCVIVAVDPRGSLLWGNEMVPFFVEGIGGDFVPNVLDKTHIDRVESPTDYDAFNMAREIIRKEGLLCGGSSGAAMFAALKAAKGLKLGAGKKVVVVLADGIRNYMTKFVCDQWMEAHLFKEPPIHDKIETYKNILEAIGNTPLVKLNRIPHDNVLGITVDCEIYAKCEFMNPGGSIKDRIAYSMITHAEKEGKTHNGTRFVEPTSGNTGIGLVLSTVVKNLDLGDDYYKTTIVTPNKNSEEKLNTMRLLGADIVQILPTDDEREVARKIVEEDPVNNIELDQFSNPVNPDTHYEITAREILVAMDKKVDMAVMGVGTGGTITGVSRYLKDPRHNDVKCTIVGVDPVGSLVWGKELEPFYVEGIGDDFVPNILDKNCVDKVVKTEDAESFNMARDIIRKEGLLCGGSSGAAMVAALKAAKELNLGAGHKVVVVFADGIRNYMTKFVCDQWMEAHLFKSPPTRSVDWWNNLVDVSLYPDPTQNSLRPFEVPMIHVSKECGQAVKDMGSANVAIVVDSDIKKDAMFKGVISKNQFRHVATNSTKGGTLKPDDPISLYLIHDCPRVITNDPDNPATVGLVSRIMDIAPFAVVLERLTPKKRYPEILKPLGIITSEMVWDYIWEHETKEKPTY